MQIIPVIDLKDGLVVHALRGNREQYQPIHQHSKLTNASDIDAVLKGFLRLYPFRKFYIADLNAICGSGNHQALIDSVLHDYPDIDFWLDNGCQLAQITTHQPNLKMIVGTESQLSPPAAYSKNYILSLDFKNDQSIGHREWFEQSAFWPEVVIAMTLHRVGSNTGPDIEKLTSLQQSHPDKHWVAAGGIRNTDDLLMLQANGINSALVATALHNSNISSLNLQNL